MHNAYTYHYTHWVSFYCELRSLICFFFDNHQFPFYRRKKNRRVTCRYDYYNNGGHELSPELNGRVECACTYIVSLCDVWLLFTTFSHVYCLWELCHTHLSHFIQIPPTSIHPCRISIKMKRGTPKATWKYESNIIWLVTLPRLVFICFYFANNNKSNVLFILFGGTYCVCNLLLFWNTLWWCINTMFDSKFACCLLPIKRIDFCCCLKWMNIPRILLLTLVKWHISSNIIVEIFVSDTKF